MESFDTVALIYTQKDEYLEPLVTTIMTITNFYKRRLGLQWQRKTQNEDLKHVVLSFSNPKL